MKTISAICLVRVTTNRTHEIGEPIELEADQYKQLESIAAVRKAEPADAAAAKPADAPDQALEAEQLEAIAAEAVAAEALAAEAEPVAAPKPPRSKARQR